MSVKLWCTSTSNPIVRQLAEKYNLTKKQAKTIYENAAENNPELQGDDVTLEFLETQQSFQDALNTFTQKYIETEDVFDDPISSKNIKAKQDEFFTEAKEKYGEDFIEDIMRRGMQVQTSSDLSKVKSSELFAVLKKFPDTKKLDYIGTWVCHYISELATTIQTNADIRNALGISEKRRRIDYFRDQKALDKIIVNVKKMLIKSAKALQANGEVEKANELGFVANNLNTILYMYGGNLFREEGVAVGPDGVLRATDTSESDASRTEADVNEDAEEDDEDGEVPVDYAGVSDQNKSVMSKIVPSIKTMLYSCREQRKDGSNKPDPYGYGLWSYISVPQAVNKLLKICKGCQTFSEMMDAMKKSMTTTPWLKSVVGALDTRSDLAIDGESVMSESKKEQLQTMFFQSFRKLFTQFTHTYINYTEDGYPYYVNTSSNVKHRYDRIFNAVRRKFRNGSGLKIFSGGGVNFSVFDDIAKNYLSGGGRGRLSSTTAKAQIAVAKSAAARAAQSGTNPDFSEANRLLAEAEKTLRSTLSDYFGITVEDQEWEDYLSSDPSGILSSDMYKSDIYGSNIANGDESFVIRYNRLNKLLDYTKRLNDQFLKWKGAVETGATTDGPKRNPFGKKEGNAPFEGMQAIRNWYRNIITELTDFSADSYESSAYFNGKSYYSWNNPSSTGVIVENLTNPDTQKVQEYILEKYGQDTEWFMRPSVEETGEPEFYSDWLNELFSGEGGNILLYDEKPTVCGKTYDKITDAEYALSMLNDYFTTIGERKGTAWYRMLINSDKPKYARMRYHRYSSRSIDPDTKKETPEHYRNIITQRAVNFYEQELRRARSVVTYAATGTGKKIKNYDIKVNDENRHVIEKVRKGESVTIKDVLDKDGKYLFRNTGASFFMNKFIVREIEDKTDLGKAVVSAVFNGNTGKALDSKSIKNFREGFRKYMTGIRDSYFTYLRDTGLFETRLVRGRSAEEGDTEHLRHLLGNIRQWHSDDPIGYENFIDTMYSRNGEAMEMAKELGEQYNSRTAPRMKELVQLKDDLDEFVYNNWLAKANMSQIFDVDLAFYGGTPNFQKRNAQTASAGYPVDVDARIHGEKVCDGKYRTITIKTAKTKAPNLTNIETALNQFEDTITDQNQKRNFREEKNRTLSQLKELDATDGQGLTSLTGFRKRQIGLGEWSRSDTKKLDEDGFEIVNGATRYIYTDEAVYQRIKRGYSRPEDAKAKLYDLLHIFGQTKKPFVYTLSNTRRGQDIRTVPTQLKNSEYMLSFLSAMTRDKTNKNAVPGSQMEAIAWFLEETAEAYPHAGIDTANFDSVVKIGEDSATIDISDMTGEQALAALRNAVKVIGTSTSGAPVYNDAVTEYDAKDYKIQQVKDDHFKNHRQQMGTQMKVLSISNIRDDAQCTLPNGQVISGKELKRRYFDALLKKLESAERRFVRESGAELPEAHRVHALSNMLKRAMATDQKFTSDARRSLSVVNKNGDDKFVLPLDDPSLQSAVEAMLYSKIRGVYYKEKSNGGIVVQATSWGESEDLAIRFHSSSPIDANIERNGVKGVMPTLKEYLSETKYGKNRTEDSYKEYCKKYQGGYAHFEAEIPMPDYVRDMLLDENGRVGEEYINDDGTWNMDAIRKKVPDSVFDAICYRIPTEAKYSMMVCRIARFSPEASGSTAKYPQELTVFTGSDFDIDTDTIELRPTDDMHDKDVDNELFDLQLAALRSIGSLQETFKSGDFSDLSEMSYMARLLDSGLYTPEYLDSLDAKKLKALCAEVEDMDLMSPMTDALLHRQNSEAKDMIGIAAVGVTSHAFISLYNDTEEGDLNPESHPQDFTRIRFKNQKDGKHVCETFMVINDSDKDNVTEKYVGGDSGQALFDMMYDMDGNLISSQISKYVGASADAAKDAALYRLNITRDTLPVLIFMHRIGISGKVARLFVSHPVIKGFCEYLSSPEANSAKLDVLAGRYAEKLLVSEFGQSQDAARKLWIEARVNPTKELRFSDIKMGKYDKKGESLSKKMDLLSIFVDLMGKQRATRKLDSFARYNSSKAMKGSSFFDRYAARQSIFKLAEELDDQDNSLILLPDNIEIPEGVPPGNIGKLCAMFPYIGRTIMGEERLVDSIILDNMKTYGSTFFEAIDILSLEENPDAMRKVYAGWKNYLLFVGQNRIADFHDEKVAKFYTIEFADHYNKELDRIKKENPEFYDRVIKDNKFIKEIDTIPSKDGYKKFNLLSTGIVKLTGEPLEQFQKDWEELLLYPETRKLATDTAIHFLARSAAFSRDTPVHVMPLKIKEAIPNYIEAFENANKNDMSQEEFETFIETLALNNATDKNIVPAFRRREKTFVANYDKGNLIIDAATAEYVLQNVMYGSEKEGIHIAVPLIRVDDNEFYMLTNNEVFASTLGEGENATRVYVMKATPVRPLGIPNQIAEYTGLDTPLFIDTGENTDVPVSASEEDQTVSETPEGFDGGSRVGTFVSYEPLDSDYFMTEDAPYMTERFLSKSEKSWKEGTLESRDNLRRFGKIAASLDLDISTVHRSTSYGVAEYQVNVSPNKFGGDTHENAVRAAAIIKALSGGEEEPVVKTYVTDEDADFDTIEITIPITGDRRMTEITSDAKATGYDYYYDIDAKELVFNLSAEMSTEDTNQALETMRSLAGKYNSRPEINLAITTVVENEEEILNGIQNEYREEEETDEADAKKVTGRGYRLSDRDKIGIGDLASVALRKKAGEPGVNEEIREMFGERKRPIMSADDSISSRQLIESVTADMGGDLLAEVSTLIETDGNPDNGRITDRVENMIINVANWIAGHRPEGSARALLTKSGIKEESADKIISIIDRNLKEKDIC